MGCILDDSFIIMFIFEYIRDDSIIINMMIMDAFVSSETFVFRLLIIHCVGKCHNQSLTLKQRSKSIEN
ncbi:hypothetical protein DERP_009702 [Dermatophagoides pteronyssinus]|uniref:Uncharacterized protein n=1 Tax=Dermatophagoides pteronyssinus TaxID=6956 RepID=A0ABQ8JAQ3_DERPT|nr:hypothetical protein DERP_009702 [Dermatophagoides pteronyssinus]